MNEKAQKFIDEAKAAQRAKFELERDELLVELGLVEEDRVYSEDAFKHRHFQYDVDKRMWYYVEPISVTDEEFEEIKKWNKSTESTESTKEHLIDNGAEKFLGVCNTIFLVICIIATIVLLITAMSVYEGGVYLVIGLALLFISLIFWASVKVVLNISNNLHRINSKIK